MLQKVIVNQYKLDSISSKMTKKYGAMKKGEEEKYSMLLFCMEGNLLKLHRENSERNSRQVLDAVNMCLLKIDGYLNDIDYNFGRRVNEYSQALCAGLSASFDPYSNNELFESIKDSIDLETAAGKDNYFDVPVKCLLRVLKSVDHWIGALGRDGYFEFLERQMGTMVKNDGKMEFAVLQSVP